MFGGLVFGRRRAGSTLLSRLRWLPFEGDSGRDGDEREIPRGKERLRSTGECDLALGKSLAKGDHDVLRFASVLLNLIMLDDA